MTRCLGACKPLLAVGVGRYNTTLLDLMVGEPVAYATGLRLKATGPFRDGLQLPDHQGVNEHWSGGVPRMMQPEP